MPPFSVERAGQLQGIRHVRAGTRPYRAATLLSKASPSPSEAFGAKIASMAAAAFDLYDDEHLMKVAASSFLRTVLTSEKFASMVMTEEQVFELLKEAGYLDNIRAWGSRAKDALTGGGFAAQMRQLSGGATSGMSGVKATINPALQQIKGPGELALRQQAKEQTLAAAADRAAARLKLPDMSGVDRSLATNTASPQAWGLQASSRKPLSPAMVLARGPKPGAAPAPAAAPSSGIQTPMAPGAFLAGLRQRATPVMAGA